jgi:hypothetical protein
MNIAVIYRPADPASLRLGTVNMAKALSELGVEITPVSEDGPIPEKADLLWDPGMCMRRIPPLLRNSNLPVVGTMRGVKAFALGIEELANTEQDRNALAMLKEEVKEDWLWFRKKAAAVVAVSKYAANEVTQAFDLPSSLVHVVHNGLDHERFCFNGRAAEIGQPYFLHVSRLDPIKNQNRILRAYSLLSQDNRPCLVAVVTPDEDQEALIPWFSEECAAGGIRWLNQEIAQEELATWYRGALALVLPSLRETFGNPIIEAMACGCPVITSHSTGCAEIAGAAAILVDPRSTTQIAAAMKQIAKDQPLREELVAKGIAHAQAFSWAKSAQSLLQVFESVQPESRKRFPRLRKLEITTSVPCFNCCEFCPQRALRTGYIEVGKADVMAWETFVACVNKLPLHVGVSFGGMSEPFQHPRCTEMILYAANRGHTIEIFTTLVGLKLRDLRKILAAITFGDKPTDNRLFVHLPSATFEENIPIDNLYIELVQYLLSFCPNAEFHYHGRGVHPGLRALSLGEHIRNSPIHDRADNESAVCHASQRHAGTISCVMNLEVNVLMPNGDVVLCCQDFACRHVIGNLITDEPETLYRSREFRRVQSGLKVDQYDVLCRTCHFAIEKGL